MYTAEFMKVKDISLHAKNCEEEQHDVFYKPCVRVPLQERVCMDVTVIRCGCGLDEAFGCFMPLWE